MRVEKVLVTLRTGISLVLISSLVIAGTPSSAIARPAPVETSAPIAPEPPPLSHLPPVVIATATVVPETCLTEEAFQRELRALLAEEASGLMPEGEDCLAMGAIDDLDWELTDGDLGVVSSGSVHQERNIPTAFRQLSFDDLQCLEQDPESPVFPTAVVEPTSPVEGLVYPVVTVESGIPGQPVGYATPGGSEAPVSDADGSGSNSSTRLLTTTQDEAPPRTGGPLLPPITGEEPPPKTGGPLLPPIAGEDPPPSTGGPLLPPIEGEDPTPGPTERVTCCSYGYSPNDGQSPGGDRFCEPHARDFDWTGAGCDHNIICRLRYKNGNNDWVFKECYDRETGRRLDNGESTLEDVYMDLGCTDMKHVTLHHSNPTMGPLDCEALVDCLPERPGQDLNVVHHQLGCSTMGSPSLRCNRAQKLVELFRKKCDALGRVRLVITGKQTDLWIPVGRMLGCSWRNPTGHCYATNAPWMRKLIITPDGFVACRLVNGRWQEYPDYCSGTGPYADERTGDSDRPANLRCS